MLNLLTINVPANGFQNLALDADYIRIQSASVPFRFQSDNRDDFQLVEGEEAKLKSFQVLKIINEDAADQTLSLYVGKNAQVGSAKVSGNVIIDNVNSSFTQSQETVTNANVTLLAANANRRYLLIQNNDTSAVLRVKLDGNNASATSGFRLEAGESLEINTFAPTGAVNVMMETASALANNVEFAEG